MPLIKARYRFKKSIVDHNYLGRNVSEFLITLFTSFGLIVLAEIGDKSQLVCMALAARHQALPVLVGAVIAFAILNLLAVLFGSAVAVWLPEWMVAAVVAVLFALFGLHALRHNGEDEESVTERSGRSVLLTTLGLIFMAEFGDKTQLAVAALAGTKAALPVWLGATLALTLTSALGVVAGYTLLRRIPLQMLHRLSGILFLLLAGMAALHALGLIA